jgi:hypothetical protein
MFPVSKSICSISVSVYYTEEKDTCDEIEEGNAVVGVAVIGTVAVALGAGSGAVPSRVSRHSVVVRPQKVSFGLTDGSRQQLASRDDGIGKGRGVEVPSVKSFSYADRQGRRRRRSPTSRAGRQASTPRRDPDAGRRCCDPDGACGRTSSPSPAGHSGRRAEVN